MTDSYPSAHYAVTAAVHTSTPTLCHVDVVAIDRAHAVRAAVAVLQRLFSPAADIRVATVIRGEIVTAREHGDAAISTSGVSL